MTAPRNFPGRFIYRLSTSRPVNGLAAAIQEKHLQNLGVKKALLATSDPILKPDHYRESAAPTAWLIFKSECSSVRSFGKQ
jgi:hypothetical protein